MTSTLHPPATGLTGWADGPDALPLGTRTLFGPSNGKRLEIAKFPPSYEYTRAMKNPDLYFPEQVEAMHEQYLIANGLTEWPCDDCGHLNHTPDAEFSMASPCTSPSCPSHTQES